MTHSINLHFYYSLSGGSMEKVLLPNIMWCPLKSEIVQAKLDIQEMVTMETMNNNRFCTKLKIKGNLSHNEML